VFKKLLKNQKGTALVFTMILITNAVIISASIVLISVMQEKTSAKNKLTPAAYQKADGGAEYILKEINHILTSSSDTIGDLCTGGVDSGKCTISGLTGVSAYFLGGPSDADEDVLSSSDSIEDINYVKVVGQVGDGINRVSRSLKTTLFVNP